MKTFVVLNGGAQGGLLLSQSGALAVGPLEPTMLNAMKATAALLLAAATGADKGLVAKASRLAVGTANLSVELAESQYGTLDGDRAIVFQDDDGGFTCGSTGKPPVPIPWPPRVIKDANDLLKAGVIEADTLELIRECKAQGKDFAQVFEDPLAAAKGLGLTLSAKSARELTLLAPSRISQVKDPVDHEVITLFHAVLKDGRFTETWFEQPHEMAKLFRVKLSETAVEKILRVGSIGHPSVEMLSGKKAIAAGIIWAGVCIAVGTLFVGQMNPIDAFIKDRSGAAKF